MLYSSVKDQRRAALNRPIVIRKIYEKSYLGDACMRHIVGTIKNICGVESATIFYEKQDYLKIKNKVLD